MVNLWLAPILKIEGAVHKMSGKTNTLTLISLLLNEIKLLIMGFHIIINIHLRLGRWVWKNSWTRGELGGETEHTWMLLNLCKSKTKCKATVFINKCYV